jgi:lipid II isoglutaminyl synthase (glutamine-hydrolysing)
MGKLPLRARVATTIGGAAGRVSRLTGRGDGSVIGGVVGLRVEPDLLKLLAVGRQIVLVTGTNGKTTTTRLITAALRTLGQEVASNAFGANMEAGLASALGRAPHAPYAVLEVDERHLPAVITATAPRAVTLLNLSRDQMDRAAEIWLVARRWREALAAAPGCRAIANADDPLVAWAAAGAGRVTWVAAGQRWHEDSWCCPQCGSHLRRDELGWRCGECGFARPPARWVLDGNSVVDASGRVRELALALPGRANRSNAVMALAVADFFGAGLDQALPALQAVTSVAGRYSLMERRGRKLRLLLAKNPAGWLEAFDVLTPGQQPVLLAVNAQVPDGKDTSWLWDVDYRVLRGRPVLVTGERRLDLAVRLEADEVAFELVDGIDAAVDRVPPGHLDVIANYTAFQHIRAALGRTE